MSKRSFTNPKQLENKIIRYLKFCENYVKITNLTDKKTNKIKQVIKTSRPLIPTIKDCIQFIGISRNTWYSYTKQDGYKQVVNKAILKIHAIWERAVVNKDLYNVNTKGLMFVMSNYDYTNTQEITHAGVIKQELDEKRLEEKIDKLLQLRSKDIKSKEDMQLVCVASPKIG